ncbi:WXG100 family type VII secretion target [Rhodococcus pyridinivorans]|uniref:WXG100 family type VII secretion target n=1 Tax=Rhodococcus pyridinivorans TaxID=103816 RepID=UPI0037C55108
MRTPPESAGDILDAGAPGLARLTDLVQSLHTLGLESGCCVADVRARYDEERTLSLPALADDAATTRSLATSLGRRTDEQRRLLQQLDESWDGSAADRARAELTATVRSGVALCASLTDLAVALESAATAIAAALREKARVVGELAEGTVDGRTRDEIDTIVAGASGGPHGPSPEEHARWFGNPPGGDVGDPPGGNLGDPPGGNLGDPPGGNLGDPPGGDVSDPAAECRRWMEERLVPAVRDAVDVVLGACEEAVRRIAGSVTDLATTTERVADDAGAAAAGVSGAGTVAPVVDDGSTQHGPSDPPNQGALLTVPGIRPGERRREHTPGPVEADRRQDENDEGGAGVVLAEAGPL